MIQPLFNWKTGLALIAIAIVSGTIIYSQFLAKKIAIEERVKVEEWVEAGKLLMNDTSGESVRLVSIIITQNKSIPIIVTDEKGNILDHVNLDSAEVASDTGYLSGRLKAFKSRNEPIEWVNPSNPSEKNFYYYGNTPLFNQVTILPYCATPGRRLIYYDHINCINHQFPLYAKPGVGGHGQRNSASIRNTIELSTGMG